MNVETVDSVVCVIVLKVWLSMKCVPRAVGEIGGAEDQQQNYLLKARIFFISPNRCYSGGKKSMFQTIVDNVIKDYSKDDQIKENIEKFKKSTQELEDSAEFKKIREIYRKMEKEIPRDTGEKLLGTCKTIMEKIQKETDQIKRIEILRMGLESIVKASESISANIKDSEILKAAVKGALAVDKELQTERGRLYVPPTVLKTRFEVAGKVQSQKIIQPNEDASGVVLHKDSHWLSTWNNFKENSPYMQKIFDLKTRYDESDGMAMKTARFVTNKVTEICSSFVTKNEMQAVLAEVAKIDSSFTVHTFIRYCQFEVIPNVLEAMLRGDTVILKDWCYEGVYNMLCMPINEIKRLNYKQASLILDVHNVDVVTGSMMDQGPMLLISFETQQINCIRDSKGNVVEGNPDKCVRNRYHWALCRDQSELNPWAAWRLIDAAMTSHDLWF